MEEKSKNVENFIKYVVIFVFIFKSMYNCMQKCVLLDSSEAGKLSCQFIQISHHKNGFF